MQQVARRKLKYLHEARTLDDLRSPPGNRLEQLKGTRKGQHSIRVNDQWRICFRWMEKNAEAVQIVDYHQKQSEKTNTNMKKNMRLAPVHPGDVLREDFLIPLGLSAYRAAKDLCVEPIAITSICKGERSVSALMALKLGRYFKTSPEIWTGLQAQYDLEVTSRQLSAKVLRIHPCAALAA